MKKLLVIVLIFSGIVFFFLSKKTSPLPHASRKPNPGNISHPVRIQSQDLFVPYWSLGTSPNTKYASFLYFGITPGEDGIDKNEPGYTAIGSFVKQIPSNKKTLLVVRMVNQANSEKVLFDEGLQHKIISDTTSLAKENHFGGIVFDLEYDAFAFDSVKQTIAAYSHAFATQTHAAGLEFYQTLYGDTFYQGRPYDVASIGKDSDGIYVMAYDFHKANGTPGPNFPYNKMSDADYTFSQMVDDFSRVVDKDKLIITFGMFGYDWEVDEKGRSVQQAGSLATSEIEKRFVVGCRFSLCLIHRDSYSDEPSITYVDSNGYHHIIWYEDMQSVAKKEALLSQKGISHIAFWANGDF